MKFKSDEIGFDELRISYENTSINMGKTDFENNISNQTNELAEMQIWVTWRQARIEAIE